MDELSANPSLKFKDVDLIERGLQPATVKRWFLKHHGMTFTLSKDHSKSIRLSRNYSKARLFWM
jgi:hypothetical protein